MNVKYITLSSSIILGLYYLYNYKKKCIKKTYNRLDKLFITNKLWEKELDIYEVAMSIFTLQNQKLHSL
jgi:hypothetical protein